MWKKDILDYFKPTLLLIAHYALQHICNIHIALLFMLLVMMTAYTRTFSFAYQYKHVGGSEGGCELQSRHSSRKFLQPGGEGGLCVLGVFCGFKHSITHPPLFPLPLSFAPDVVHLIFMNGLGFKHLANT